MPWKLPWPTALNAGGSVNSDSGVPLVMTRQRPRTITIAASDVMKWLSPTTVTKKPMMRADQRAGDDADQARRVHGSSPGRNSEPESTIAKQTTEPTARSMPPTIKQDRHADDDDAFDREAHQHRAEIAAASGNAARRSSWRCRAPG